MVQAIANNESQALALVSSAGYRLRLRVLQGDIAARTQSWTLNTNRDVADITSLGRLSNVWPRWLAALVILIAFSM